MPDLSQLIAKNLKKIRESKGLSQDAVAKAIGVSRQTIVRYESGEANFESHSITKLAKFFEVEETEFVRADDVASKELIVQSAAEAAKQALLDIFQHVVVNNSSGHTRAGKSSFRLPDGTFVELRVIKGLIDSSPSSEKNEDLSSRLLAALSNPELAERLQATLTVYDLERSLLDKEGKPGQKKS